MIGFEDAKKAVESIYGTTQGFKLLTWSNVDTNSTSLSIGDNYVFFGDIYVNSEFDVGTSVIYAVNGNAYGTIGLNNNVSNSFVKLTIMETDSNVIGDKLIIVASQATGNVYVIGWLFQINK